MREAFGGTAQRIPAGRAADLVPRDRLPDVHSRPRSGRRTTLDRETWPGLVPDVGPAHRPGEAADGQPAAHVLPAARRGDLQLPAQGRACAGRAGNPACSGPTASAKGSLEPTGLVDPRGERRARQLRHRAGRGRTARATIVPGRAASSAAGGGGSSEPRAQRAVTTMTYSGPTRAGSAACRCGPSSRRGATKSAAGLLVEAGHLRGRQRDVPDDDERRGSRLAQADAADRARRAPRRGAVPRRRALARLDGPHRRAGGEHARPRHERGVASSLAKACTRRWSHARTAPT